MWKIIDTEKVDVLKKTQENLEATQKNSQMLADVFGTYFSTLNMLHKKDEKAEKTEEEKLRAAYALNLCTVSVSQIIDYNDIYFLEREYDAILNNLNLEKMPKDEALLSILRQLLDVITFFRIQEGDRKLMEKEYDQKMKNAIWSAIPNPSMIVAGGSPVAIAVSLASQVGIGYMNYRKEKAIINQEKERKEWELQRSAMEQFNGLRRELFDTAWRLADEYNFPDEYRITERQISQYNNILLDADDLRRYERLEYISDKFKAYPPFWYYLGNAANLVYQDERYPISVRGEYKNRAMVHFDYFFRITEQNLLREDQLIASCALEMFDLVEDKSEKMKLLEKAKNASGNAFDVLQICAVSYLKIGEVDKTCGLLKMLINENYNATLNAQLLSRLYVSRIIDGDEVYRDKYETLVLRFPQTQYLYPLPKVIPQTEKQREQLSNEFARLQKNNLKYSFADVMKQYICRCESKYCDICRMAGNITSEMAGLIKEMADAIELLVGNVGKSFFLEDIKEAIGKNGQFKKMIESGEDRGYGNYKVSFDGIFKEAFMYVARDVISQIADTKDMSDISSQESRLYGFISKNNLENENYILNEKEDVDSIEAIFGESFRETLEKSKTINKFVSAIRSNGFSKDIINKMDNLQFIMRGDMKFNPYIDRNRRTIRHEIAEDSIVAILNDTSGRDTDLIFTTKGVYVTGWVSIKGNAVYKNITVDRSGKRMIIGGCKYYKPDVNLNTLDKMIKVFAELANENRRSRGQSLAYEIQEQIENEELSEKGELIEEYVTCLAEKVSADDNRE